MGTLNINGGRERHKRALISEVCGQKRIDVLFLQETHSDPSDETDWALWWDGFCKLSHGTNFSAGVAILFKASANAKVLSCTEVVQGRLLVVRAEIEDSVFCFVNVYAPNIGSERVVFYSLLKTELMASYQDQIVMGGILTALLTSL